MAHLDLVLEIPEAGVHRLLGQRRERHRRDEVRLLPRSARSAPSPRPSGSAG
jgi:hypothetical protein